MPNQLTLNQKVKRLEALASSQKQINSVYVGDIVYFLTAHKRSYPACAIEVGNMTAARSTHQHMTTFTIWYVDMLDLANGNEIDLISDLSEMAKDMIAMINYNGFIDWFPQADIQMSVFTEQMQDYNVAVAFDITIGSLFLADRCQVPTDYNFSDEDNTYLDTMKVLKTDYRGLGTEGNTITLPVLKNRELLLVAKGQAILQERITEVTEDAPLQDDEYLYDIGTGGLLFEQDIQPDQLIHIIHRSL